MEQRPLRLGDIVDDYCPRERRITNHAVVAVVDQTIRQTRCATCDAEHDYKEGREPKRRKKESSALYDQVLADVTGTRVSPRVVPPADDPADAPAMAAAPNASSAQDPSPESPDAAEAPADADGPTEVWTTHRPLIRATLPRTADNPPLPRSIPEFTMHQRQNARFGFRQGGAWAGNENGQSRGGQGGGFGNGHPRGNGHGGGGQGQGGRPGRHRGGRPKRAR